MPGAGGLWGQWRSRPPSRTLAVGLASVLAGPCRRVRSPRGRGCPALRRALLLGGEDSAPPPGPPLQLQLNSGPGGAPLAGHLVLGCSGFPRKSRGERWRMPRSAGTCGSPRSCLEHAAWLPACLTATLLGAILFAGWRWGRGAEAARTRLTPTQSAPAPSGRPRPCRAGRPHPSPGR